MSDTPDFDRRRFLAAAATTAAASQLGLLGFTRRLNAMTSKFRQLFISEWIYCRNNREWALECLAVELRALEFFAASSGLVASRTVS